MLSPDQYYELMDDFEKKYLIKVTVPYPERIKPALDIWYDPSTSTSSIKFYAKKSLFEKVTPYSDDREDNVIHISHYGFPDAMRFFVPAKTFSFIDVAHYFN